MELKKAVDDLRISFGPNDYNLIRKNCNHFANSLVYQLVGKQAPGYINRIADVGACCSCLLPKKMLENAPVGDPDGKSNDDGTSSFGGSGIYARGPNAPQANTMQAFTGTGARLGGVDSSSTTTESEGLMGSLLSKAKGSSSGATSAKGSDDLTDRREKARKAALARFEKQKQSQGVNSEQKDK